MNVQIGKKSIPMEKVIGKKVLVRVPREIYYVDVALGEVKSIEYSRDDYTGQIKEQAIIHLLSSGKIRTSKVSDIKDLA